MFAERWTSPDTTLRPFVPAPPATDREAWDGLSPALRAQLLADGDAVLNADYPALPATLHLDYARTGDRARFETAYFARRRMLNAMVLAECVEHRGRFLDRIVDGLLLICEESGWQLPAHNSQVRGGPRAALADVASPIIDLFAAETGAQLAVAATVLAAELDAVTPEIVQRIDHELDRRILTPYLGRHFWWMGNGDEPMNNWTAWCTQNVLLTTFSRPTGDDLRRQVIAQAAASLDAFAKDYGDDGACEEGVLYYRHAGLCLFNALVVLDAVAPESFGPLWREPKLRNMAEYIVRMHVEGRRYFNFADSSAIVERCGAREYLFGKAVGSALLADFAAGDWAAERKLSQPDEINLFYRLQAAFTFGELEAHRAGPPAKADSFLPSIGLMVAHDDRFALAAKAGNNGESHNHNDVGSVTLYKLGRPVLIDIGVETYTKKTFSADRYDIWTMQSAWHNLPTFEGVMQRDGAGFAARDVAVDLGAERATMSMDFAAAYPPEAGLRTYRRTVTLAKGQGVTIEDIHDGDKAGELTLMFAEEPQLEDARIVLSGLAEIAVTGAGPMRLETIPITDARLRIAWPDTLWRVLMPFAGKRLTLTIS
jgi:hypothetical protein